MRFALLALALCNSASVVAAQETSAEDACAYFLPELKHGNVTQGSTVFEPPTFQKVSSSLNRYTLLTTGDFRIENVSIRDDGREILHGIASALATCLVDEIDRRVLQIAVLSGNEVGTIISDARNQQGGRVEIKPVAQTFVEVGNLVHMGKY